MRSLEQLDSWISSKVKAWSSKLSGTHTKELLELRRDILADVRDHIQPKGGGKSVFPYNTLSIVIAAENVERQRLLQDAFRDDSELEQDIQALIREAGAPLPANLTTTVSIIEDPAIASSGRPVRTAYSDVKAEPGASRSPHVRPAAKLRVIRGQADAAEYTVASDAVNIGRLKEVIGDRDGLRRRNHVAFAETETSVSREHAAIRYDPESGTFRVYDSMSQRGTSVFRDGRRLLVPKGSARGVQLRSGDEIHVGDARLAFEICPAES